MPLLGQIVPTRAKEPREPEPYRRRGLPPDPKFDPTWSAGLPTELTRRLHDAPYPRQAATERWRGVGWGLRALLPDRSVRPSSQSKIESNRGLRPRSQGAWAEGRSNCPHRRPETHIDRANRPDSVNTQITRRQLTPLFFAHDRWFFSGRPGAAHATHTPRASHAPPRSSAAVSL